MAQPKGRRTYRPSDTQFDATCPLKQAGRALRAARKQAGLSARELGVQIGLTASPILHFETGRTPLRLAKLLHAFAVLQAPLGYPFAPHIPAQCAETWELFLRADALTQAGIRAMLIALDPPPGAASKGATNAEGSCRKGA